MTSVERSSEVSDLPQKSDRGGIKNWEPVSSPGDRTSRYSSALVPELVSINFIGTSRRSQKREFCSTEICKPSHHRVKRS